MSIEPDVSLILPAFNEAATIRSTIVEAKKYFSTRGLASEIIVAADGDDGTREIVAEMAIHDPRLRVFGDRMRLGKGRGVRLAVELASGAVIGYADADNKVPIQELDRILPRLSSGADLVVGSRALSQSKILRKQPWYRRAGSWGFGVTMRTITGLREINDTQCGFKFFMQTAAKTIFHHQRVDGYMFERRNSFDRPAFGLSNGGSAGKLARRWRQPLTAPERKRQECSRLVPYPPCIALVR